MVWEEVRSSTLRYISLRARKKREPSRLQKANGVRGRESRNYYQGSFMNNEVGSIFKVIARLFRPNRGSNGGWVLAKTWRSYWGLQLWVWYLQDPFPVGPPLPYLFKKKKSLVYPSEILYHVHSDKSLHLRVHCLLGGPLVRTLVNHEGVSPEVYTGKS